MTMNELTTEQAFNNVAIACEKAIATKAEHIAFEKSLNTLKDALFPVDKKEQVLEKE
jgi:hypothetical protein